MFLINIHNPESISKEGARFGCHNILLWALAVNGILDRKAAGVVHSINFKALERVKGPWP